MHINFQAMKLLISQAVFCKNHLVNVRETNENGLFFIAFNVIYELTYIFYCMYALSIIYPPI